MTQKNLVTSGHKQNGVLQRENMTLLGLTERFSIWSQGTVAASGRKLSFIWLTSKKKFSLYGAHDICLWSDCQPVDQYMPGSDLAIKTP